jgi:hypothetical protein
MSETRQTQRRQQKKKMQPLHEVKRKGGQSVTVLRQAEAERLNRVREHPDFPLFKAAYEWLLVRPPVLGCDPADGGLDEYELVVSAGLTTEHSCPLCGGTLITTENPYWFACPKEYCKLKEVSIEYLLNRNAGLPLDRNDRRDN